MNETSRIEAFSDGVFAIAITLLILEIKVPEHGDLGRELMNDWPSFLAFLASFFTIGVMWMNHHRLFTLIEAADDVLIGLNLLLLLGITWIPFPTALLATHTHNRVAALVYSSTFFVMSLFFQVFWGYATRRKGIMSAENSAGARQITWQYIMGPILYLIAIGIAFVSGPGVLIWSALVAVYFAFPASAFSRR
jgi:TMEM175 potassium channel family protein